MLTRYFDRVNQNLAVMTDLKCVFEALQELLVTLLGEALVNTNNEGRTTTTQDMAFRITTPAEEITIIERWDHGITWMAHPEAQMQRASHALVVNDDVWLIDPLDAGDLDDELAALGTVAGVVVLGSEHHRHADRLAARHDVSIHLPAWFEEEAKDFDAPVVEFTDELADTGFEVLNLKDGFWQEAGLYHPERRTLAVSETFMTALFTGVEGRVELFPPARLAPPHEALDGLDIDRLLVGHGEPVFENVEERIQQALAMEYRSTAGVFLRSTPIIAKMIYTQIPGVPHQ